VSCIGVQEKGAQNSVFTQITLHENRNMMEWYFSDECRKNRKPGIQKIHVFIAEEKECGFHLSIMHTLKVPVHKIPSFFTIYVFEFVNHKYFLCIHSALVSCFLPFPSRLEFITGTLLTYLCIVRMYGTFTVVNVIMVRVCRVRLKPDGTRWRSGGEVKRKLANGMGSQYTSHYLGICNSNITTADTHTSAASSGLNWPPPPPTPTV
jgi:hypothetical protein